MASNLTRYNQTQSDRATAAHDESLFGHYVEECGWTVKEALENLAPIAKHTHAQTISVASTSKWLAVAGGVIGLLGGGTVGLIGALPIGAAALAFFAYREAQQCIPRREVELRALKNCPVLLELMYGCHLKGIEGKNLIAAWDIFLDNYADSGNADGNLMAREYLRILDSLSVTIYQDGIQTPQELPKIIPPPQGVPMPPEPDEPVMRSSSAIQANTRLNAVNVPAQTVQRSPVQPQKQYSAFDALMSSPFTSRAFFGAQRTGKSYLAAIASKEIHKTKNTKIYHINLLSYALPDTGVCEDDLYWNHATKSVRGDLPTIVNIDDAIALIDDTIALVQEWFRQPNAILIVDEIAYTGSTANEYTDLLKPLLKLIADKIAALASGGIKRNQAIWTIAPEFVAGTLSQDAKAVKKLQLVYVTIPKSRSIDWNGNRIGFNVELFDQIKANFTIAEPPAASESDRICFVDNKWLPVGDLPSLEKQATPQSESLSAVLLNRTGLGGNGEKK